MRTPENDRAVEVSAIVGGERAALNERDLHRALVERAAALVPAPVDHAGSGLFQSFFMGGFECATHCRRNGGLEPERKGYEAAESTAARPGEPPPHRPNSTRASSETCAPAVTPQACDCREAQARGELREGKIAWLVQVH